MMILAIDGGTTNTRLTLLRDGSVAARHKLRVGARDESLADAISAGIRGFLSVNGIHPADISCICASGMITSDAGLYNLPHIPAPAGLDELRAGKVSVKLPVCELPITFIPGVKLVRDGKMLDIMRGEETEVIGILHKLALDTCTLILPGSHMKCVHVENSRIVDFTTSMTGELSRAAAEHTILSRSLGDAFPKDPDVAFIRRGHALLAEYGSMNAALFKLRVTAMGDPSITADQLYAMLLGIVLSDDVRRMPSGAPILVGGSNPFRAAYLTLLGDAGLQAEALPEDLAENAAAYGAWEICKPQ